MRLFEQYIQNQNATHHSTALQAPQAHNPSGGPSKYPTFRGKANENVMSWLFQIEELFNFKGYNDDQCIHLVASCLEGAALQWMINEYQVAHADGHDAFGNWDDFKNGIKLAFQLLNHW